MKTITYEEWIDAYKPIEDEYETIKDFDDGNHKHQIQAANAENRLWTLKDGDGGELFVHSGYGFVNKLGLYITEVPHPGRYEIEVDYGYDEEE